MLNKEKALHPPSASAGFFFVYKRFEISNLKLVDDIFKIVEFIESKVSS
jgi:hypothetical protein